MTDVGKMTGSNTEAAQSYLLQKTINSYFLAAPANWRSYKLLRSPAIRDAPRGTWDLVPGHRRPALHTRLRPQPSGGTPPHQLSPALETSPSLASPSPLAASPAAATLIRTAEGSLFQRLWGRGHGRLPGRGAWVGAARCPRELGIHHPLPERSEPPNP